MFSKYSKLEMTVKKVKLGERCNGIPEECWIARYEHKEQDEADDASAKRNDRSGVA